MLKLFILFSVLLAIARCQTLEKEENVCQVEEERWVKCEKEFQGKMIATGFDYMAEQKKMLECIGDLKCKGQRKLMKFQYDATIFMAGRKHDSDKCIYESGHSDALNDCLSQKDRLSWTVQSGPRKTIIQCVKEVVEKTNCSKEEKNAYVGYFAAMKDLTRQMTFASVDDEYMDNFDLTFEPSKYGL